METSYEVTPVYEAESQAMQDNGSQMPTDGGIKTMTEVTRQILGSGLMATMTE